MKKEEVKGGEAIVDINEVQLFVRTKNILMFQKPLQLSALIAEMASSA